MGIILKSKEIDVVTKLLDDFERFLIFIAMMLSKKDDLFEQKNILSEIRGRLGELKLISSYADMSDLIRICNELEFIFKSLFRETAIFDKEKTRKAIIKYIELIKKDIRSCKSKLDESSCISKKNQEIYLEGIGSVSYIINDLKLFLESEIQSLDIFSDYNNGSSAARKTSASLKDILFRDSLTGAFNRKYYEEVISYMCKCAEKAGNDFSCILFDIDHFKRINDIYGHKCGDIILKSFVSLIMQNIPKTSMFCRYGGEEFVLLIPNVGYYDAIQYAEDLRELVQNHNFERVGKLTISGGVSSYNMCLGKNKREDILHEADINLYFAKSKGRNRVEGYNTNKKSLYKNNIMCLSYHSETLLEMGRSM